MAWTLTFIDFARRTDVDETISRTDTCAMSTKNARKNLRIKSFPRENTSTFLPKRAMILYRKWQAFSAAGEPARSHIVIVGNIEKSIHFVKSVEREWRVRWRGINVLYCCYYYFHLLCPFRFRSYARLNTKRYVFPSRPQTMGSSCCTQQQFRPSKTNSLKCTR